MSWDYDYRNERLERTTPERLEALRSLAIYKEKVEALAMTIREEGEELAKEFGLYAQQNLTGYEYQSDINNAVAGVLQEFNQIGIYEYSVPELWMPSNIGC